MFQRAWLTPSASAAALPSHMQKRIAGTTMPGVNIRSAMSEGMTTNVALHFV